MSVYWRWVATRTAVAGVALLAYELLAAALYGRLGEAKAYDLLMLAFLLASAPAIWAEALVLSSRFPTLPVRRYMAFSLAGAALFTVAMLLNAAFSLDTYFDLENGSDETVGLKALLGLALTIAAVSLAVYFVFLSWQALKVVAEGRSTWRLTILLAILAETVVIVVFAAGWDLDYATWRNVGVQILSDLIGSFSYALISGIGVARLRPIAETTP